MRALEPTYNLFKEVLFKKLNSDVRRWVYQRLAAAFFFAHDRIILHMSRQTGKTYLASVLVACYVLCGKTVVVCFPTLKQGKRLLLGETLKRLRALQRHFPALLKFEINNQEEILCVNGGRVIVLTTNSEAKSREGYSASLIVIDEAHQAHKSIMDELFPITFAQEGSVKILMLGVGGYKNSLIADQKKKGCSVMRLDGETIAKVFPPYVDKVRQAKETLSPEGYACQIMCLDRLAGEKLIFDCIMKTLPGEFGRPVPYAGIDVGWTGDDTVVTIFYNHPQGKRVVDWMKIKGDWKYQAAEVVQFLRSHHVPEPYTCIEANAIGQGLIEAMSAYSSNYNTYMLTAQSKAYLIDMARMWVRDGTLAVEPDDLRDHLESLILETHDDGKITYEHSDELSSLLMGIVNFVY